MTTENEGTTTEGNEAPTIEAAPAAAASGTPTQPDEVTTLRSRNAGLDAKVTSLTQETAREKAAREAAEAKLRDYEAGKVGADEALRAQLSAKDEELARERAERRSERIESKYPETFGVLGAAALGLTEDQLAASEARFAGVETGTPAPAGANAPRVPAAGAKAIEDMSVAELAASLAGMPRSAMGLSD